MLDMKIITLRKLKVIYFFVNSEESLENYANSGALLKLHLIIESKCNNDKKTIGYLSLPIKDYIDSNNCKKDFYKFFHVDGVPYGWGLEGSIGFLPS